MADMAKPLRKNKIFLPLLGSLHTIQQLKDKEKDKKINCFTVPSPGLCG